MDNSKKILAIALIVVAVIIIGIICFFNNASGVETITDGTLI